MASWKVEIYANEKDTSPIRTGIVIAGSQDEAEHLALQAVGEHPKAELIPLIAKGVELGSGQVIWLTL